ncbi:AAA family ATPase [Nitrosophilus kaiyonis]|uniref:AAA family ATPase n=1 Tax=Nitrosophilus kaiyonis TaxID=2930200 RepID=UPI002491D168|nr:AAA family ATPase [Nitrosophilus kaiyonis]
MENKTIFIKAQELKKKLKKEIFGQNEAIEEVVDALIHINFSPTKQNFKALFTFLGPHNSGKVYLAKLLAKYSDEFDNIKIFDMAEFTDPNDQKKLIGENGSLTNFVKKYPNSIIVFKDIDKADNVIQLAILNYIKAPYEESGVDFSNILIIFTSTLGSNYIKREDFLSFYKKDKLKAEAKIIEYIAKEKKVIYDLVENAIDPELLSTIVQNYIILFKPLKIDSIYKIAQKVLNETIKIFKEKSKISIEIKNSKDFIKLIVFSFSPYINARRIHKKLPDFIIDLIYTNITKHNITPKKTVFEVDKEALSFIDKIKDEEEFVKDIIKRNESVELKFDSKIKDNILDISIKKATKKRLPLYISPYEKPALLYSNISFDDVAGQKSVKKSLKEIIEVLKHPNLIKKFSIDMPKGMLLYGPKGVGKTLLGLAFAKEANLPYIYLTGSDLFDENLIRVAYEKAKEFAPAIIFLDEIDTKGLIEGVYTTMPPETLINELDSLNQEGKNFVFTIATAINKEDINKNIIAPGRIDIFVEVPELDMEARKFFIKKILEKPNDGKIDINRVARYMSGMSGYEMQRVGKEAALYVIRKNLKVITEDILIEQINNIKYGYKLEKKRIRNIEKDLHKTAYHEAGHAVLSYILLPDIKIEQVTITPRAETLGFVSYTDQEFITNISKEELFNDVCVALAGRIAKLKKFPKEGEDTGASQDLEQATWEVYNAIANFGMDEEIGYVNIDTLNQNVSKSLFKEKLEERISYWIQEATKKTKNLVDKYWNKIEKVANELIKKEIIDGNELKKIMEGS